MNDIKSREDIDHVIRDFYAKLVVDEVLKKKFDGLDIETHIPVIVDFWQTQILYEHVYAGNPLIVHVRLNLVAGDFNRWLELFAASVRRFHEGENANAMVKKAFDIAELFERKLGILSFKRKRGEGSPRD